MLQHRSVFDDDDDVNPVDEANQEPQANNADAEDVLAFLSAIMQAAAVTNGIETGPPAEYAATPEQRETFKELLRTQSALVSIDDENTTRNRMLAKRSAQPFEEVTRNAIIAIEKAIELNGEEGFNAECSLSAQELEFMQSTLTTRYV
jgi:hypothetical protein